MQQRGSAPGQVLGMVIAASMTLGACGDNSQSPSGIDFTAIDRSVSPCQDFYRYSCGEWINHHPLPADGTVVDRFSTPYYAQLPILREIVEKDAAGARASDDPQAELIGRYYQSCMAADRDFGARSELGTLLAGISAIASMDDLAREVAVQRGAGSGTFFSSGESTDVSDPTRRTLALDQGGIELSRHYYIDPADAADLDQYRLHIAALARFFPQVSIDPVQVMAVESALARAALDPDQRRDPRALHHVMAIGDLARLAPTFPWSVFLQGAGLDQAPSVDVVDPAYFTALDQLLTTTPLGTLKMYMAWQLIQDEASYLDEDVLTTDFAFWGPVIRGQPSRSHRWYECYSRTLSRLGMAISRPYIARHFDKAIRGQVQDMLPALRAALNQRISTAAWLDEGTRGEALAKLAAIAEKIAYPDSWQSFDGLAFGAGSYLATAMALAAWNRDRSAALLTTPVDRTTWSTPPATVNAFYSPGFNEIVVPAGILALPFFVPGGARASNLGGIGVVIGHELTHGFDDSGRLFDATGVLRNWWTPATESGFTTRAQCLVNQYSSFEPLPGLFVDGTLTLSENIADLGGVHLAYDALMTQPGGEPERLGYDGPQQFFLSFAQVWCRNARPEYIQDLVATDPHSPAAARVNGTLANVRAFAQAFKCETGTPMAPVAGCAIW